MPDDPNGQDMCGPEPDLTAVKCPTCGATALAFNPNAETKTTGNPGWAVKCSACGDGGHAFLHDDRPSTFCCFRGYAYRVVRETCGGTTFHSIREVYPDGRVDAEPSPPAGASIEDLRSDLLAMVGALDREVVEYDE